MCYSNRQENDNLLISARWFWEAAPRRLLQAGYEVFGLSSTVSMNLLWQLHYVPHSGFCFPQTFALVLFSLRAWEQALPLNVWLLQRLADRV